MRLRTLATALVLGLMLAAPASGLDPEALRAELDLLVPREMAARHVPALVVVVVDRERVLLDAGYGFAELASQTPVDPARTAFRVASVSKLFTSTALMQLVERGQVDLDGAVSAYLPELAVPARDGRAIAPRHLLTHTSGLGERFIRNQSATRADWLPLADYLARGLPAQHAAAGEVISYANYGMGLAGRIVESVHGQPFDRVVMREILEPLGMHRSSFGMEPAVLDGLAQGYVHAAGEQRPVPVDFRNNMASGGLVTTGADMARFLRAFLNGGALDGARILRPETVAAMLSRQWSPHPALAGVGFGFWELADDGRALWGHDGDVIGFHARALLAPEAGLGVFIAYTGTDMLQGLSDAVTDAVLASLPRAPRARLPRVAHAGAGADGTHRWTRTAIATRDRLLMPYWLVQFRARVAASGELELSNPLGIFPPTRWEPVGTDLFQEIGGPRRLALRIADGRVTHLVLERSPLPLSFERIHPLETVPAQGALLAFFALAFLALALGGALAGRRAPLLYWVGLASAANLAFLIAWPRVMGLHLYHSDLLPLPGWLIPAGTPPWYHGEPPAAQLLLALPIGALGITALLGVRALRGSARPRLALAAFVALQLGFAFFLRYWNLLGWTS